MWLSFRNIQYCPVYSFMWIFRFLFGIFSRQSTPFFFFFSRCGIAGGFAVAFFGVLNGCVSEAAVLLWWGMRLF